METTSLVELRTINFNLDDSHHKFFLLLRVTLEQESEGIILKQTVDLQGVNYPVKVIETTVINGKRKALIRPLPYYTDNIFVNPGAEEVPIAKDKRAEFPDEQELIAARDKERKAGKGRIFRWGCPYCSFEFLKRCDGTRHFDGRPAGKEACARPITLPV